MGTTSIQVTAATPATAARPGVGHVKAFVHAACVVLAGVAGVWPAEVGGNLVQRHILPKMPRTTEVVEPRPGNGEQDERMIEVEEPAQPNSKQKQRSKCSIKGHSSAECNIEVYCDICDSHNEHVNHRCPILKMPKPVVHAVGYAVEGLGFYHIPHPPLSK